MGDVTSGLLSANAAAKYQLTAKQFPVVESATGEDDDDDCAKTGVSSSWSQVDNRRPQVPGDTSATTCISQPVHAAYRSADGPHSGWAGDDEKTTGAGAPIGGHDDVGGLERLSAEDSAVGRLAMMIQRFTGGGNDPGRDLPSSRLSSRVAAAPLRPLMTSFGDVTSCLRDRARYFCHACPFIGKSPSVISRQSATNRQSLLAVY